MSALASLVSAFTVQAAINTPASTDDAVDSLNTIDPNAATVAPPTMPAPAAPAVVRHVVDVANATPTPQPVAPVEQTLTGGTDLSKYASGGSSGGGSGGSSGGSTGGGTTGGSTGGGGSSGGSRGSR